MINKQKNYLYIQNLYYLKKKNNIMLICHKNDINNQRLALLNQFCYNNNIKYIKLNSKLLNKLSKNNNFKYLLKGPTSIFYFNDINSYINFKKNIILNKYFIPLSICINYKFYSYKYFLELIKYYTDNKYSLEKNMCNNLISYLNIFNRKYIFQFTKPLMNFFMFLNKLK